MMPEEIKAIVRKLLAESDRRSWEAIAADWDGSDMLDAVFAWLKQEAEKPSTFEIARGAAAKVLKDPKASKESKPVAASVLTQKTKG